MTIKAKIKFDIKPVVFKIDADFESILESVKSYEGFYSKKISRSHSLLFLICSIAQKYYSILDIILHYIIL